MSIYQMLEDTILNLHIETNLTSRTYKLLTITIKGNCHLTLR